MTYPRARPVAPLVRDVFVEDSLDFPALLHGMLFFRLRFRVGRDPRNATRHTFLQSKRCDPRVSEVLTPGKNNSLRLIRILGLAPPEIVNLIHWGCGERLNS